MKRTTNKELTLVRLETILKHLKTHTLEETYKEYKLLFTYFYLESNKYNKPEVTTEINEG